MNTSDAINWIYILGITSGLGLIAYLILNYKKQYKDIKGKIHSIRLLITALDDALKDDEVSKEELSAMIQECLALLDEFIK